MLTRTLPISLSVFSFLMCLSIYLIRINLIKSKNYYIQISVDEVEVMFMFYLKTILSTTIGCLLGIISAKLFKKSNKWWKNRIEQNLGGISRRGRSTKIHAVVDGLGYPLVLELTGGQVHDGIMLQNCLEQLDVSGSTVLADKAYGSWENREYIANHDADFCIPPKSNSADPWYTDFYHYKERHLVDDFGNTP